MSEAAAAIPDLRLALQLTPQGQLRLRPAPDAAPLEPALAGRLVAAFAQGTAAGLLQLGGAETGTLLPPVLAYWRQLGRRLVTALCTRPPEEQGAIPLLPPPPDGELVTMALAAPPMAGAEYVTVELLRRLWTGANEELQRRGRATGARLPEVLASLSPAWHVVGRVHFHLAENRKDPETPFAFLATYTSSLSTQGQAQHQPLGQALREFAGKARQERLLSLLLPVQRASETCDWLRRMVDEGELFHPLRWTAAEAFRFLADVPRLEQAGIVVRMPAAWRGGRPPRPRVTATVGSSAPAGLGQGALLDFRAELTLDGEPLTPAETRQLLAATAGLVLLRGQWVEVDRERVGDLLERFRQAEQLARDEGLTFASALRLLAGADVTRGELSAAADPEWSLVTAGPWLRETLRQLREAGSGSGPDPGPALQGTLRPYQRTGLAWLHLLTGLGLGACLADDMGLGKTVQLLALLLVRRQGQPAAASRPNLLVAPASLLANWAAELGRFAPSLQVLVAHPSALPQATLKALDAARLAEADLVVTSYGSLQRLPALARTSWKLVILDEAQAIKNPQTRQTRAVKELTATARVALTGTPVENRLDDLWSLFDFLNPGLLGSAREFLSYAHRLAERPENPYGPLRELVRPYILRRLKTDRSVITDLPAKTELKAYCPLSRKQAALYQQTVAELTEQLAAVDGVQRRGVVLASLLRLKQICNHPSQWLGDGGWAEADSGKLGRLRELAETFAARQEKVLVFTQFRETTGPLAAFLGGIFGLPGLVLHGQTPVKARRALVQRFQEEEGVPFFVLSLKAGGTGLNLTAASHVIHFDRWWNPAVEDQATDRAFRIGQTRNVLVHKFVCRGTVEEKIDQLIESKRQLSTALLEGGGEPALTELSDEELLALVRLDLRTAAEE
ncbi:MAG: DEAD/DEAH box helicase [Myxococcota bacterium]|jgi:non-specific serine/threonine protein kinase|nr:DEAD/DEAH box helicase [Myxococcota bacterium]